MAEPAKQQTKKPAVPKKKDNTLKIILIIVGVFVGLMILGTIAVSVFVGSIFNSATKNIKVDGDGDKGSVTIKSTDGSTTATYGNDASLPEGFPSDVPIYEPSTIVYATKTGNNRFSASAKTSDSASQVLAFYKADLSDKGWTNTHESSYGQGSILTYEKDDTLLSVSVSTQDTEESEKTFISLGVSPSNE